MLAALLALVFVSGASALTQRPFKETFGSAEQPSFGSPSGIAVDQETGDVLVADESTQSINRFHADGTPAPFAALGTNQIDGKLANGKPCAEEPASCDRTPQEEIKVNAGNPGRFQIAIDESEGPTKGDIYLTQVGELIFDGSQKGAAVDIFASDGHYLGQLTVVNGRPIPGGPTGVAVDSTGALYVGASSGVLYKFVPTANPVVETDVVSTVSVPGVSLAELELGTGPAAGSLFAAAQFSKKVGNASAGRFEVLQLNQETGQVISEFAKETAVENRIAVNPATGNVLTNEGLEYAIHNNSEPVRVGRILFNGQVQGGLKFGPSDEVIAGENFPPTVSIYGAPAPVPTVTAEPAEEVTGTRAAVSGTVDPDGGPPVTKCVFEYGKAGVTGGVFAEVHITYEHEVSCEGLNPTEPGSVHAAISGLESNGGWYGFRLVAFSENGREETAGQTFKTVGTVVTEPAAPVSQASATLNGTLRPEGDPYSECFFQYGLASTPVYEKTVPCNPDASSVPANFQPQPVEATITGLRGGSTYRFRLVATNGPLGTLNGEELTFSTHGLPTITEVGASGADQSSISLEAKIDPRGFGTSYDFEWGPTPAYGNSTPITSIGSGTQPIPVQAMLSGLAPGGTYHYRVSATSSRGTVWSSDELAETLDSCGLPEGRCFELVSRPDAGPAGTPGVAESGIEMHYQAATGGLGGLAYPVENGYPEATVGANVLYRGLRGPSGWQSTQLTPPISAPNERADGASVSSFIQFLSNDLSCGVVESVQPLTTDPSMHLAREEGIGNLYRINPEGSSVPYTGITKLPPQNVDKGEPAGISNYRVAYASQDCNVVLFSSVLTYPGVVTKPGLNPTSLYEWREGTLRNAGMVPGPAGEVVVAAVAGSENPAGAELDSQNAVSEDGSRIFITAERQTSSNPEEIGKKAIFVREDGRESRDVSLSATAVPDEGASYQWATANGSKVFFTANAGLTSESNTEGTDLYEYDLATEELTDRSVTSAEGGAEVFGLVGASADGSQVYFASPNQLVPGSGNSHAQNLKAGTYSIYGEKAGVISFVGTIDGKDSHRALVAFQGERTSQVSPDGRYLLFESSAHVTDYENAGVNEVYLYDAESGSQGTTCVSCRQDGQPSTDDRYGMPEYQPLARSTLIANELHPPQFLAMQHGQPRVFFSSPDPLAPGAVAGQNNIYEWSHGQIFRLVSAAEGTQQRPAAGEFAVFGGASEDGSDIYLITPETLTWQDGDLRLSAYDARIGGGFPEPPAPPPPCDASQEDSCLSAPQGAVGPQPPDTRGDSGAQNFETKKKSNKKKHKPKKHKKQKHPKKSKKQKQKSNSKRSKREATGNRRNRK